MSGCACIAYSLMGLVIAILYFGLWGLGTAIILLVFLCQMEEKYSIFEGSFFVNQLYLKIQYNLEGTC